MVYVIDPAGAVQLVNYPGFNDIREHINNTTQELLSHTDVFALVVDVNRGVTRAARKNRYHVASISQ
jgi:predicted GTPase